MAERVKAGGHAVPEDVVRHRYEAGRRNFFEFYRPLAEIWRVDDNSTLPGPRLIAADRKMATTQVVDQATWEQISRGQADGG